MRPSVTIRFELRRHVEAAGTRRDGPGLLVVAPHECADCRLLRCEQAMQEGDLGARGRPRKASRQAVESVGQPAVDRVGHAYLHLPMKWKKKLVARDRIELSTP